MITLVVTIILLAILTFTVVINFEPYGHEKRRAAFEADVKSLKEEIDQYYARYGELPILKDSNGNAVEYNQNNEEFNRILEEKDWNVLNINDRVSDSNGSTLAPYYVIDTDLLNVDLNYKDETFIVNSQSHTVYFPVGVIYADGEDENYDEDKMHYRVSEVFSQVSGDQADKIAPEIIAIGDIVSGKKKNLKISNITSNSFKMTAKAKDADLGLYKIVFHYRNADEVTYRTPEEIEYVLPREQQGTTEEVLVTTETPKTLKTGDYWVYIDVYDMAGNKTTFENDPEYVKVVSVDQIGAASLSTEDWTNQNIIVSLPIASEVFVAETGDNAYKKDFITQYYIEGIDTEWQTYNPGTPIEIDRLRTLKFRYTDGINVGPENTIAIDNIDKEPPTVEIPATVGYGENLSVKVQDLQDIAGLYGASGVSQWQINQNGTAPASVGWQDLTGEQTTASTQSTGHIIEIVKKAEQSTYKDAGTYYVWAKDRAGNVNEKIENGINVLIAKIIIEPVPITGSVTITGENTLGKTLTAQLGDDFTLTDATITYQWYSNSSNSTTGGTPISGATSSTYTIEGGLIGKYIYVEVTVSKNNYATTTFTDITDTTNNSTETVSRKKVTAPTPTDKIYNGQEQTSFEGTEDYTVTGNKGTNAQTYEATVVLADKENTVWADNNSTEDKTLSWIIQPAEITVTWGNETSFTYNGEEQAPTITTPITGVNGEQINLTVTGGNTNSGSYTATATISSVTKTGEEVGNASNYTITNPTQAFTIINAEMTGEFKITGRNIVGDTLTATMVGLEPDNANLTYQWYVSDNAGTEGGTPIAGATNQQYTLTENEVGKHIYVIVTAEKENYNTKTFTDDTDATENTSATVIKITVTLDPNGGEVTPTTVEVAYNAPYGELPTPTKTGYTFGGWFTGENGTGTEVTSSTIVTIPADHTLIAEWTANNYKVRYNANGGTGTMVDQTMTYDQDVTLTANAFTKTGYTFTGWNGLLYSNDAEINNTNDVYGGQPREFIQYADFAPFFDKYGTDAMYHLELDLKSEDTTNNDLIYIYFQNGSSSKYKFAKNKNIRVSSTEWTHVSFDSKIEIKNDEEVRAMLAFYGTYDTGNNPVVKNVRLSVVPQLTDGQTVRNLTDEKDGIVNLFAQWTANTYTVTVNANGGTIPTTEGWTVASGSETATKGVTFDSTYGTLPTPEKTGYTFNGWVGKNLLNSDLHSGYYNSIDGDIAQANGQIYKYTEVTSLLPSGTYTLSCRDNNISVVRFYNKTAQKNIYNPGNKILPYTFTLTEDSEIGFSFRDSQSNTTEWLLGNNTAEAGIQLERGSTATAYEPHYVTDSTVVTIPSDHTLTAEWSASTYRVTYSGNGATHLQNANLVAKYDGLYNNSSEHSSTTTTWSDISGNSRPGTVVDGTWGDEYLEFNGTSTWVNLGKMNSDYQTLEATFSLDEEPTEIQHIISNMQISGGGIFIRPNRRIGAQYFINGAYHRIDSTTTIELGKKYHVALTYDGTTEILYINGVQDGTPKEESGIIEASPAVMILGGNPNSSGTETTRSFKGKIYNAAVYNTALTAEQVATDAGLTVTYDSTYSTLPTPERAGYTFSGWYTGENGTGTQITSETTVQITQDTILYAKWTANNYTITANANGGTIPATQGWTIATGSETATKGITYDNTYGALPIPARTGYTFAGWYTEQEAGTQIESTTTVKTASDHTLYARWTANRHTLTINPNGGTWNGTTNTTQVTQDYGTTYNVANNATREGYVFGGWRLTSGDGDITYYNENQVLKSYVMNNATAEKPKVYNNLNNGSVTHTIEEDATSSTGYSLKIQTNGEATPNAGGFANYNNSIAGTIYYHKIVAKIPTGYTIESSSNITGIGNGRYWITNQEGTGDWQTYIYAQFTGYNSPFSTFGHVNVNGTDNQHVTWYIQESTIYQIAANLTELQATNEIFKFVDSDATLTAEWRLSGSGLKIDTQGGTLGNGTIGTKWTTTEVPVVYTHAYDTKVVPYYISDSDFAIYKTGYTLDGWYTAATGGVKLFDANGQLIPSVEGYTDANRRWQKYDSSITIYAHWTPNKYNIVYDGNGATSGTTAAQNEVAYDQDVTLNQNGFSKEYTVTYEYNGATGGNSETTATASSQFLGWTVGAPNLFKYRNIGNKKNTTINADGTLSFNMDNTGETEAKYSNFMLEKDNIFKTDTNYVLITDVKSKNSNNGTQNRLCVVNSPTQTDYFNDLTILESDLRIGLNHSNMTTISDFSSATWSVRSYARIDAGYNFAMTFRPIIIEGTYGDIDLYYYNQATARNLATEGTVTLYCDWAETEITLPIPTKTGYTFEGWYTDSQFTTPVTLTDGKYIPTENTTLYAKWTANNYTITFNAGQGVTVDPASKDVTYDSTYGTLPTPTKAGYTFDGWYTGENGTGTKITSETTVETTANTTLYAKWTANTYTVTANANGGTIPTAEGWTVASGNETATKSVTFDNAYGELPTPTRAGYTFSKWVSEDNLIPTDTSEWEQGAIVDANGVNAVGNVNNLRIRLKNYLKVSPNTTYKITANNTNNIVIRNVWFYNENYEYISKVSIAGTSKEFSTPSNCSYIRTTLMYGDETTAITVSALQEANLNLSAEIGNTTIVAIPSNHTLTAEWTANNYTITFNAGQGVTVDPASKDVTYDSTYGTLPTPTKAGYTFDGWYTGENGTGTQITSETTVETTVNTTLYAKWTANTYTVTANANGGTIPEAQDWTIATGSETATKSVTYDSAYGTLPTPTKTGYTFDGWVGKNLFTGLTKGKGINHTTGSETTNDTNRAVSDYIAVDFNSNSNYYISGMTNTLRSYVAAYNENYEFLGRTGGSEKTKVGITSTSFIAGTPSGTGEIKYIKVHQYKVESNTGTIDDVDGLQIQLEAGSTATTYEPHYVTDSTIVTIPFDHTLTAEWSASTYTVTVNANGGTIPETEGWTVETGSETASKDATYDSTYGVLPTPERVGYTFDGWYTAITGGTKVESTTTVKILEDQTLYTHWTPNSYTATFNDNYNMFSAENKIENGITIEYNEETSELTLNGTQEDVSKTWLNLYKIKNLTFTEGEKYDFILTHISGSITGNGIVGLVADIADNTKTNISPRKVSRRNLAPILNQGFEMELDEYSVSQGNAMMFRIWFQDKETPCTFNNFKVKVDFRKKQQKQVTYDSTYGTLPTTLREGYTFDGWYTEENGTGDLVTENTPVKITENTTYYAHWTINKYDVKCEDWLVDASGNRRVKIKDAGTSQYDYGTTVNGEEWGTTLSSYAYNSSTTAVVAADNSTVVYRHWYKHIDLNFSVDGTLYSSGYPHQGNRIKLGIRTRGVDQGYKKDYAENIPYGETWEIYGAKLDDVEITTYQASGTIDKTNPLNFNFYTLSATVNNNEYGTVEPTELIAWEGETYTTSGNTLTMSDGRTITGVPTNITGYTTAVSSWTEASGTISSTTQVIANFTRTANTYTVTVNANGGTMGATTGWNVSTGGETATKDVTYDSTYGTLPTPSRIGYTFNGWYTGENGTGTQITSETTVQITENTTLYAKWTANTYRVTYSGNGATHLQNANLVAKYDGLYNNSSEHSSTTTTWSDISGNSRPGTVVDGTWGDEYLEFNGTSTWVNLGEMNTDYQTLEATFSIDEEPTEIAAIISNAQGGGGGIAVETNRAIRAQYYIDGKYRYIESSTKIELGKKYHVALTYNGTTEILYINGVQDGTPQMVSGTIKPTENSTVMVLGGDPRNDTVVGNRFKGRIYNAAVYNTALTAEQVAADAGLTVTYDSTYSTLPTPERAGYTFGGWYTGENGTGTQITSETTVQITENTTLYAKWTANTYRVTYSGNGATHLQNANVVAKYDGYYNTLTAHNSDTTTLSDLSGNNRNGTMTDVTLGDDYLEFNGTSSWVNLGEMNSDYQTLEVTFSIDEMPTERMCIIGNWSLGRRRHNA